MDALAEALGIRIDLYASFLIWGMIFTRILVMLLLTPFLGTKTVPARARVAMAILFSLFLYPFIGEPLVNSLPDDKGLLIALYLKEVFFGFTVGLISVMVFYAFEAAGRIVDNQRGAANAMIFLPSLGQVSIFGLFNFWLAIAVFLSIGGHRFFLEAFFKSFQTVPLLTLPKIEPGISAFLDLIVHLSGDVLIIAVQLAAPVLIATLLVDLVLGIANKMAPQINVFELGFAIKGYIAPLIVYISLLIMVTQMEFFMNKMVSHVSQVARLFSR